MAEYLDVPGGRIAYDQAGEGPLVVCAPGLGDLRGAYRFLVPRLTGAGYRVATMDLRGHGQSGTGWDSYSQASVGADIIALIRHLGGPAVVIGNSFSCGSAVVAAADAPGDVGGIVLIAPFANPPKLNPLLALLTKPVMRSPTLWGVYYRSLYPGAKPPDFAAYLAALKANLRQPGRMAAAAVMATAPDDSARPHRSRVRCPVLIVMGSRDSDFPDPRAEAEAMAAALPGPTEVVMLDGAGHYPHAQRPAETGEVLLGFLEQAIRA